MTRLLTILALSIALEVNAGRYFIDYGNGNDANSGTTTNQAWKHHPFAGDFTGSYAHANGDRFIFKGGVVYDVSGGGDKIIGYNGILSGYGSGSSDRYNPDYYGVDTAWFTGATWTRPIFDGGRTETAALWFPNKNNVVIDRFWFREFSGNGTITLGEAQGIRVMDCWFTGVYPGAADPSYPGYAVDKVKFIVMSGLAASHPSNAVQRCYFTGSPGPGNFGAAVHAFNGLIADCVISNLSNGIIPQFGMVSNNFIAHIQDSPYHPSTSLDVHENGIEQLGNGDFTVCYNTIVDAVGVSCMVGFYGQKKIFNNLIFSVSPIALELDSRWGACTNYVYNNTLQHSGTVIRQVVEEGRGAPGVLYATNNHFIGGTIDTAGFAAVYQGNNVTVATGYTAPLYKPTSASASTVNAGIPVALFSNDKSFGARPTGGAWDAGCWEYGSTGGVPDGNTNAIISLNAAALSYGPILSTLRSNIVVTITNTGGGVLTGAVTFATGTKFFATNASYTCGTNQTTNVTLTYVPTGTGTDTDTATFSGGGSATVALTGQAYPHLAWPMLAPQMLVTAPWGVLGNYAIAGTEGTRPESAGRLQCQFTVTNAMDARIQMVVVAPNGGANSVWVNVNAEPTDTMIWHLAVSTTDSNQNVGWQGTGTYDAPEQPDKVFTFGAGTTNTIIIKNREANTQIKSITLVPVVGGYAPTLKEHPASQDVMAGDQVKLEVNAEGSAPLTITWKHEGTNVVSSASISGENTITLTINPAAVTNAGVYYCTITNGEGYVISDSATVTVSPAPGNPPAITVHPVGGTIPSGGLWTFTVTATGDAPLIYYWMKNGSLWQAQTYAHMAIWAATTNDSGTYSVIVSNAAGTATSDDAVLVVQALTAPVVTNFMPVVVTNPVSVATVLGSPASFWLSVTGTPPFTYVWKHQGTNIVDSANVTGQGTTNLAIASVATTNAGSYYCVASNAVGQANTTTAVLTAATNAPTWVTPPSNLKVRLAASAPLPVAAAGTPPLTYTLMDTNGVFHGVWQNTPAGYIEGMGRQHLGSFQWVVRNDAGAITSSVFTVGFYKVATVRNVMRVQP